jgi:hypothetical protein
MDKLHMAWPEQGREKASSAWVPAYAGTTTALIT